MTTEQLAKLTKVLTDASFMLQNIKQARQLPAYGEVQDQYIALGREVEQQLLVVKAELLQVLKEQPTPNWHRNHECLNCGHEWHSPVKLSKYTANLSGEETAWCPECSSRNVVSSPAYDLDTYNGTF